MAASGWARWPLVAALGVVPVGMGSAQTYTEPAYYGNHVLEGPGQSTVIEIYAGGSIDAATLGGSCVGMISDAPDVQLELRSSGAPLTISVETGEGVDVALVVNTTTGEWLCDDDGGEGLDALLRIDNPPIGAYDIWIAAVDDGEEYSAGTLTLSQGATPGRGGVAAVAETPAGLEWMKNGVLEAGDTQVNGRYADAFPVTARAGEELVFDLRSSEFDTYLTLRSPSGASVTNDDYDGSTSRSLLSFVATEPGRHTVTATSYDPRETGAYTLSFARVTTGGDAPRVERGTLAAGDETGATGRYTDTFRFEGAPGRRAVIDLASRDFDSFLVLRSPSGVVVENDDAGTTTDSRIDTNLSDFGTYEVTVTSYEAGETGAYTLTIDTQEAISSDGQADRDTIDLEFGGRMSGRLETSDLEFQPGRFQDIYAFSGEVGDAVRLTMDSTAVDTYLVVRAPSGTEFVNDDFDGSTEHSVVEFTLAEAGRYQVVATTYGPGMTGAYDVALSTATGLPETTGIQRAGSGRVFGIFAGISDYSQLRETNPGWGDLDYTADDAISIHRALMTHAGMQPGDAHILPDRQATRANIEAAFRDIGARIGPNDAFVFFFSGHGGQVERPDGPDMLDADGQDETLALSDQEITDDEMRALFDGISARVAVIILDSCFSGGFAKDVVSAPGRMGMFSSDEDVTSLVALKFEAGGYLSYFLEQALENGEADENDDRAIDALELSQYIRLRYSQEAMLKSRFSAPDFSYQHLVVDRGGVTHDTVLFSIN